MGKTNFLIGNGELLASPISSPKNNYHGKKAVYSFSEAKEVLLPQFQAASSGLYQLPSEACPNDFGVLRIAIHPEYLAKSYYPRNFMKAVDLTQIGSKSKILIPRNATNSKYVNKSIRTTELYMAGKREDIKNISATVEEMREGSNEAIQLAQLEEANLYKPAIHIKSNANQEDCFEVAVHLLPDVDSYFIKFSFYNYAKKLGFKIFQDFSFSVGTLYFVPIFGPLQMIEELKQFVFIRVIRTAPQLRSILPSIRSSGVLSNCRLPISDPLSSLPRVAILDGGLPKEHLLSKWVKNYRKMDTVSDDYEYGNNHGLAVASAFLFGPIDSGTSALRPFSYIDHIRILDKKSGEEDPLELYRTLGFIEEILLSRQYEFLNLSLGPDIPIEDDDVHSWTALIDQRLSDGNMLMTIAAGNNGEKDRASGNARVMVPGDCINALTVGSSTTNKNKWDRAPYSAIGPGRRPGVVKPDIVAFGGSASDYFHVLAQGHTPNLIPTMGTSFASPYLLRNAVGVKAILGDKVTPLVIKALLIHTAQKLKTHEHVGWGKVPDDINEIITCREGVARVIYKGTLVPGKYIRAKLPIPKGLQGSCEIMATFCYASQTNPQDAGLYTKAGLEIQFRPNILKMKGKQAADAKSFFSPKAYASENELIKELGKWENVLHSKKSFRNSTLNNPVFDIHYIARDGGAAAYGAENIPYVLILTIKAPKHPNIFNEILNEYPLLAEIQPQVSIPLQV